MNILRTRQLSQKIFVTGCRAISAVLPLKKQPYWLAKFPDGKPRSFDEMPTIEDAKFDYRILPKVFSQWFKKYGHVVRLPLMDGNYTVNLFHFDDFDEVYQGDSGFIPKRRSHQALAQYRASKPDLYSCAGLAASDDEDWLRLRYLARPRLIGDVRKLSGKLEPVVDDLIRKILSEVGEGGEIEILPWLIRWSFESTGVLMLDKRLGALDEIRNEEADKMVEAVDIGNEMIALTTIDPETNYAENYQKLASSQDYFYSFLIKHIEEVAEQSDSQCAVKKMTDVVAEKNSKVNVKDVVTVTLDTFQGAMQVPMTVMMALYNVARNKDVQTQARKELLELLPSKDSKYHCLTFSDGFVPYTRKIVLETLRLSPPIIGNGRIIQKDLILGGYNVPSMTNCILHYQVACLLEENFENPLKFYPDRHKTSHGLGINHVFGGSSRMCIGSVFANLQMTLVLSKLLRNFEFSYEGGEITMINKLHNEPEKPLFMRVNPLPQ